MKWPWQQIIRPNRATLTLLPNDRYIIGLPTDITDEAAHRMRQALREWLNHEPAQEAVLVLPFPVDVEDKRR